MNNDRKKVRICKENIAKLDEFCDELQKGSKVRKMTGEKLLAYVEKIEKHLDRIGIPKKDRHGMTAEVGNQYFAKAYRQKTFSRPQGSIAFLECTTTGWFVYHVIRQGCDGHDCIHYTQYQQDIIAQNAIEEAKYL